MGIKKIALLSLVSLASLTAGVAFAAEPTYPNIKDLSGLYLGIDGGAVYNTQLDFPSSVLSNQGTTHTPWAWTGSIFLGYQFNSNWGLQFGYVMYQQQKLQQSSSTQIKFSQYNMYLAARISVPLLDQFSAYALIGPVYTKARTYVGSVSATAWPDTRSIWTPMGALGVTYNFCENLNLSVQYMYIMQDIRSLETTNGGVNKASIDSNTQRLTFAISYFFEM